MMYEIEGMKVDKAAVALGLEVGSEARYEDGTEGGLFLY